MQFSNDDFIHDAFYLFKKINSRINYNFTQKKKFLFHITCHGLALIDKQLDSYFGFDTTLDAEATKMNGTVQVVLMWRGQVPFCIRMCLGVRGAVEIFQVTGTA